MSVATSVLEGPGNNSSLGASGAQATLKAQSCQSHTQSHSVTALWKRGSEKLADGTSRWYTGYTAPKIAPSYSRLGHP